jgi:hypothetical protein
MTTSSTSRTSSTGKTDKLGEIGKVLKFLIKENKEQAILLQSLYAGLFPDGQERAIKIAIKKGLSAKVISKTLGVDEALVEALAENV